MQDSNHKNVNANFVQHSNCKNANVDLVQHLRVLLHPSVVSRVGGMSRRETTRVERWKISQYSRPSVRIRSHCAICASTQKHGVSNTRKAYF